MEISNPPASTPGFDVFLSHNSKEKDSVRKVKEGLAILDIKAWLDDDEMPPGTTWQHALEQGLKESRTVAVFIGQEGMGSWHDAEMQVAINQSLNGGKPVIPVLLPGCSEISELPAFLQNYKAVDFRNGLDNPIELKRLAWAITGKKPVQPAPVPGKAPEPPTPGKDEDEDDEEQDSSVQNALDNLEAELDSVNITYIIGQGINQDGIFSVISPQHISRELMKTLQLIDQDYSQLVPTIDTSSAYFAMGKTDSLLEKAVARQLQNAPDADLPTYQKLAALLELARERGSPRGKDICAQLVVTSNFDLLLERCLLRAGLPFTRLVQYRASPRIDINEYKNVRLLQNGGISVDGAGGTTLQAGLNDTAALDKLIANCNLQTFSLASTSPSLSLSSFSSPIIYKINGSCDKPKSCLMTIDQHLDFIWRQGRQSIIPDQIRDIVDNTPLLFIGSRILDPDFRLGYYSLLHKEEKQSQEYKRYALLAKPRDGDSSDCCSQMLRKCRRTIKNEAINRYAIEIIDVSNEEFLESLRQRFANVTGG